MLSKTKPKKVQKKELVQYTKNKELNDVLNETVGLSKGDSEMDEYPTMGGGVFDSSRAYRTIRIRREYDDGW